MSKDQRKPQQFIVETASGGAIAHYEGQHARFAVVRRHALADVAAPWRAYGGAYILLSPPSHNGWLAFVGRGDSHVWNRVNQYDAGRKWWTTLIAITSSDTSWISRELTSELEHQAWTLLSSHPQVAVENRQEPAGSFDRSVTDAAQGAIEELRHVLAAATEVIFPPDTDSDDVQRAVSDERRPTPAPAPAMPPVVPIAAAPPAAAPSTPREAHPPQPTEQRIQRAPNHPPTHVVFDGHELSVDPHSWKGLWATVVRAVIDYYGDDGLEHLLAWRNKKGQPRAARSREELPEWGRELAIEVVPGVFVNSTLSAGDVKRYSARLAEMVGASLEFGDAPT